MEGCLRARTYGSSSFQAANGSTQSEQALTRVYCIPGAWCEVHDQRGLLCSQKKVPSRRVSQVWLPQVWTSYSFVYMRWEQQIYRTDKNVDIFILHNKDERRRIAANFVWQTFLYKSVGPCSPMIWLWHRWSRRVLIRHLLQLLLLLDEWLVVGVESAALWARRRGLSGYLYIYIASLPTLRYAIYTGT